MGAAGAVLNVAGLGMNLAGLAVKDNARKRENKYAQTATDENARIAGQAAVAATERGQQQEAASRMKYGALRGDQTTAMASAGVTVNQGSALDILANTQAMSDYDAKVIHNNAAREAWGFQLKRRDLLRQKGLLKQAKEDGDINETLEGLGMAIGTVGSMAGGMGGKG